MRCERRSSGDKKCFSIKLLMSTLRNSVFREGKKRATTRWLRLQVGAVQGSQWCKLIQFERHITPTTQNNSRITLYYIWKKESVFITGNHFYFLISKNYRGMSSSSNIRKK